MILLSILAVLAALYLMAAYFACRIVFGVPKGREPKLPHSEQYRPYLGEIGRMIAEARAIPYEKVRIISADGLTLCAKYYGAADEDAPVMIMLHGYRSEPERDFSGGLPFALSKGYRVLLPDERAHGESGGKYLTFGVMEQEDCLSWVRYAMDRFGRKTKIVLYGMSMGAATVLMAGGLQLPQNVKGILADCGYTSPKEIIQSVMRNRRFPVFPVWTIIRSGACLFAGFDPEAASCPEALKKCTTPVCLIHGEDDRFVPCSMSRENLAACRAENKRLFTVPGAGHGMSYLVDKEGYTATVESFLDSVL